jgi:hypothetical protein
VQRQKLNFQPVENSLENKEERLFYTILHLEPNMDQRAIKILMLL